MNLNTNSILKMSHQAVPCRLMPKRAQKETSYYPSESETGPESEVEDDEDYDAEDKASSSSKVEECLYLTMINLTILPRMN